MGRDTGESLACWRHLMNGNGGNNKDAPAGSTIHAGTGLEHESQLLIHQRRIFLGTTLSTCHSHKSLGFTKAIFKDHLLNCSSKTRHGTFPVDPTQVVSTYQGRREDGYSPPHLRAMRTTVSTVQYVSPMPKFAPAPRRLERRLISLYSSDGFAAQEKSFSWSLMTPWFFSLAAKRVRYSVDKDSRPLRQFEKSGSQKLNGPTWETQKMGTNDSVTKSGPRIMTGTLLQFMFRFQTPQWEIMRGYSWQSARVGEPGE